MYLSRWHGGLGRLSGPEEIVANVLSIARGQIGVAEDPRGSDDDPDGRIKAYRQAVTNLDPDRKPEPWCADFVSWVFKQAGVPLGPKGTGFASNKSLVKWLKSYAEWWEPGEKMPKPGDILILALTADKRDRPNHTSLVESVNGPTDVVTIDGNFSQKVSRARWKDKEQMYMFGRTIVSDTTPTVAPQSPASTTTPAPQTTPSEGEQEAKKEEIDLFTIGIVVASVSVLGYVAYSVYKNRR